jgi:ABC-type transport system substrate-binding protein
VRRWHLVTRFAPRFLVSLLPVVPLVAGCVEQIDPSATSQAEVVETPSTLAFDDGPTFPDDELTLGLVRPDSVAPSEIALSDQGSVILTDLLYDGLTEPAGTSGTLRPALALSWEPSDNASVWTFTLDTTRIDAEAVAAHFTRLVDAADNPVVDTLLASVQSVEVVDASQVQFVLDSPDAGFPWLVSGVALSIPGADGAPTGVHRIEPPSDDTTATSEGDAAATGSDGSTEDGGSGAEVGDEITALFGLGDEVVLRSTVGGRPDVAVRWYKSEREAYNGLTLAQVDAAVAPSDALSDAANRFGEQPQARTIARFYGINADGGPLADARLRGAVLGGLDRQALAEEAFAAPVFATDGVVAPTAAGYHLGGCADLCRFDAEAARAAVTEVAAEIGSAPELTIAVTGDDQRATAERIAADLEAIGFAVVVSQLEPGELAASIAAGQADLFAFGWVAGAGSLDAVVPQLFGSTSAANALRLQSDQVDALIREARATVDDAVRWDLLTEAHDLAMGEGRVLPLAVAKSNLVAAPQAAGLVIRADGSVDLSSR